MTALPSLNVSSKPKMKAIGDIVETSKSSSSDMEIEITMLLYGFMCLLQPQYSYVDGDRSAPAESAKNPSISLQQVGAAGPILLDFAPPSTPSYSSSSKVSVPNPFNRPHAVFLLELNGIKGIESIAQDNAMFSKSS
ncbi:uncharacterized protein LOC131609330 isoform X3 [Vicia villosa]|uniref:uncharacterized protein LOC131609330 isoform X3 n=1 Tax=Vicia villosa TaxID=3911 RepID=UPI00273B1C5C|nr:uncharacterized protein LOC131609330 isoform X3 [Vicia villosa]